MSCQKCLELQIREATERLICVSPDEQTRYLTRIAKLAGTLVKEKRSARHNGSGVMTSEFHEAVCR